MCACVLGWGWSGGGFLKHGQCLSDLCGPHGRKTDAVCLAEASVLTLSVVFAEVESTFIQV